MTCPDLVLDLHLTSKLGPSTSFRGQAWHIRTPWHADEPPGSRQPGTLRALCDQCHAGWGHGATTADVYT